MMGRLAKVCLTPKWMFAWALVNAALVTGWAKGVIPEHFAQMAIFTAMLILAGRLWGFASGYKKGTDILDMVVQANNEMGEIMLAILKLYGPDEPEKLSADHPHPDDGTASREE